MGAPHRRTIMPARRARARAPLYLERSRDHFFLYLRGRFGAEEASRQEEEATGDERKDRGNLDARGHLPHALHDALPLVKQIRMELPREFRARFQGRQYRMQGLDNLGIALHARGRGPGLLGS